MKPSEIGDILEMSLRARTNGSIFNPCFVGAPGLGKTEIIQQWAKDKGLASVTLSLSTIDPPDFKGFPNIEVIRGRQRLNFATPHFWPDEGMGVIILEEMNRSQPSIMQCILSLADARRGFDGYRLPEGWIIVASVNAEEGLCDVTTMDPALKDRFEMFSVVYDKQTHVDYMSATDYNKELQNFIESGTWSYQTPETIGNTPGAKYNSPRTFSKLNAALFAGFKPNHEQMIYDTILGGNVGKDFYNFRHNESPVMFNDLLKHEEPSLAKLVKFSDPNNYKNGMISLTVKDILDHATIKDELLAKVVRVIPVEQGVPLIRDLEIKTKDETLLTRLVKAYPDLKTVISSVRKYGKTKES